ncbi:hypothetical protein AB0J86_11390 [Micromonospora sp. NPDC049559]|uniref:hypothetical protein n=1 Tax=Micromonospora sp. NPDC049559 TaxID=3155923 RepID=UPI003426B6B5
MQLLEAPVNRRNDPRAQRSIVDHLPPGTTINRRVLVKNESGRPLKVDLYPEAATIDHGAFQYGGEQADNELTSWISLDRRTVELPPQSETRARVTIQVPMTAPAGERYGVVWAAVATGTDPSASVHKVHRVGVRVYLDIGPGGEPRSDFTIGDIVPSRDVQGVPSVSIGVRNTGGRALDMTGSVNLSDGPAGMRAGPFQVASGTTLAPGQAGQVLARLPAEISNGPWKIEINLRSGTVTRSVTATISFPDPGKLGKPGRLSRLTGLWGIIGTSLGIGLVVIVGLVLVIRSRGRRDRTGV